MLELQKDGKLVTSDDPPVVFGSLDKEFIQKVCFEMQLISNKLRNIWNHTSQCPPLFIRTFHGDPSFYLLTFIHDCIVVSLNWGI